MGEILFEVTKDHLETGLRGIPVGYCITSYVDPQKGLFYKGRAIKDLVDQSPEEVMYFLYSGKPSSDAGYSNFLQELKSQATLPQEVVQAIYRLPKAGHPMKLFCIAILLVGMLDGKGDYQKDCLNLIAKAPHLVACVINHHSSWGSTPTPDPNKSYMENFVDMLQVPGADKATLLDVMRIFNILHYDHGGGNLSTFTGKAVASGKEDLYGAMCSAMCALAGPLHGKANQDSLAFVKKILSEVGEQASGEDIYQNIKAKMAHKELIFGFGHAVLREEDSRASVFYEYGEKHFPDHPYVHLALLLREYGTKALMENPKIADPHPNVDAISGSILSAAGFEYPEYFTVLFGMARIVGIGSQIVYERCIAREGKGTPIVRPKYIYKPES